MTPSHALATRIAGELFDRIERDKTLLRSTLEEVIHDELLLFQARRGDAPAPEAGNGQAVVEAAKIVVKSLVDDSALLAATPRGLLNKIENLYAALQKTGWHP